MKVSQILDMINSKPCCDEITHHHESLKGPRTRGSTTERGLDIISDVELEDHTEAVKELYPEVYMSGCRYFYAMEDLGGDMRAIPLGEAIRQGMTVKMRDGDHGPELYAVDTMGIRFSTDELWIIVGPHTCKDCSEPHDVVFTWHPGYLLGPLMRIDDEDDEVRPWLSYQTGVKLEDD